MRKKITVAATSLVIAAMISGCGAKNEDVGKWGVIELPDGHIVEGTIESITRWSHSNFEVQIDGKTYCTHPVNFACYDRED